MSLDIDTLASRWHAAKLAEKQAMAERYAIEEEIIALVGAKKEGTTTKKTSKYTVKTVGKLTHSVNDDLLHAHWAKLPQDVQDCFIWRPSVSQTRLKQASDATKRDVASFLTTKPAKVAVQVVEIDNGN